MIFNQLFANTIHIWTHLDECYKYFVEKVMQMGGRGEFKRKGMNFVFTCSQSPLQQQ